MRRAVITGMGIVSPVGSTLDGYWNSLKNGVCGIGKITRFDASRLPVSVDAEVKDFDAKRYFPRLPERRRSDLFIQYAVGAATDAVEDSGILGTIADERLGVYIGSGIGGIVTFDKEERKLIEKGPEWISPFFIPMMISNMASGQVSIRFKAKGPTLPIVTACATSTHAIGEAFHAVRDGYADAIIAGGTEAAITEIGMAGFVNCKALNASSDPETASLPFDRRRGGFVMGEGAGVVIIEELEHAKARGAKIYAEIAGYGNTSDAYHITAPDPEGDGAARVMDLALHDAGLSVDQIPENEKFYVNAHGTGTRLNDAMETKAMKKVFEGHTDQLIVSSTKSMTGHMLGAAGAAEAIASVMAVKDSVVPPTIHLDEPDPELDLDYTPHKARKQKLAAAMSTSYGFGGHNAAVVVKPYKEA